VARAVSGLREFLAIGRKRVPGDVLHETDRPQCLLFDAYDLLRGEAAGYLTAEYGAHAVRVLPRTYFPGSRHHRALIGNCLLSVSGLLRFSRLSIESVAKRAANRFTEQSIPAIRPSCEELSHADRREGEQIQEL
jgi:hypothetical protein